MTLAVDATSHYPGELTLNGDPRVFSHTCGASATKLLVLTTLANSTLADRNSTGCTYNGVAATILSPEGDDGVFEHSEIYNLNSPTVGANNISVGITGNNIQFAAYGISFVDAHDTLRSNSSATGTGTNPSVTGITTVAGDIVVGVLATDNAAGDTAVSGAGVLIFEDENVSSDSDFSAQYVVATGTSTNLSWTNSGSGDGMQMHKLPLT